MVFEGNLDKNQTIKNVLQVTLRNRWQYKS